MITKAVDVIFTRWNGWTRAALRPLRKHLRRRAGYVGALCKTLYAGSIPAAASAGLELDRGQHSDNHDCDPADVSGPARREQLPAERTLGEVVADALEPIERRSEDEQGRPGDEEQGSRSLEPGGDLGKSEGDRQPEMNRTSRVRFISGCRSPSDLPRSPPGSRLRLPCSSSPGLPCSSSERRSIGYSASATTSPSVLSAGSCSRRAGPLTSAGSQSWLSECWPRSNSRPAEAAAGIEPAYKVLQSAPTYPARRLRCFLRGRSAARVQPFHRVKITSTAFVIIHVIKEPPVTPRR